jgi:hypothetical protein
MAAMHIKSPERDSAGSDTENPGQIRPPGGSAWPEMPLYEQSTGTKVTFKLEGQKPADREEEKGQVFKIASADDSDSIFEDRLKEDQIKKLKEVEDEYDDEDYGADLAEGEYSFEDEDYSGEQEYNRPQKLPLETILEEDSVLKKATPDQKKVSEKLPKKKVVSKSRSGSRDKRIKSAKQPSTKPAQAYTQWPGMSDAERKVAEADAYLKKL